MPETTNPKVLARSAFHDILHPGRLGVTSDPPGIRVSERVDLTILFVAARKARTSVLRTVFREKFGFSLPESPERTVAGRISALWAGPDQWMVIAEGESDASLETDLLRALDGLASITDLSDGRGVLRISGSRAREALAKGLAIDLDPAVFQPGMTALTMASMIDIQIWQLDDAPTYEISLFRGFSGSFWHWLESSCAEFGLQVDEPG